MRRAEAIWHWNGSSMADVTADLGELSGGTVSLATGDKLYIGYHDWLSGLLFDVNNSAASIVVEAFDGQTDTWRVLPTEETIVQGSGRSTRDITAYNFDTTGMAYWGTSPYLWQTKVPTNRWPENLGSGNPPDTMEYFWVRVRNTGAQTVSLIRVLPAPYNTYTDIEEIRAFAGLPDQIREDSDPTATYVRNQIRSHEDGLDNYTRKTWRLRPIFNELHDFNPHAIGTNRKPIWGLTSVKMWQGSSFEALNEGRDQDYFYDPRTGMIYFTFVSFGIRGMQMNRYARQGRSIAVNYIAGEDFDVSQQRQIVSDIIKRRVAADLAAQTTWSASFVTGDGSSMSKKEMVEFWKKEADDSAAILRGTLIS